MIIDSRVIRASIGDDLQFLREAAADFVPAAHADIAIISRAVSEHDAEGVRTESHKLRGSAAIFGAHDLRRICLELESAAEQSHWESIRALVTRLVTSMEEVEVALEEFLKRVSSQ